jgi:alpha-1,6-mannosyltransferase
MSAIGHKEWRFVVYVVPMWNAIAARGMSAMYVAYISMHCWQQLNLIHSRVSQRKSSLRGRVLFLGAAGALLANLGASLLLTRAAIGNYPGGAAMGILNGNPTTGTTFGLPCHYP